MKRVITLKDGKIISDQKQHGIYRLDSDNDGMSGFHNGRPIRKPGQSLSRPVRPVAARQVAARPATPRQTATRRVVAASKRPATRINKPLNTPGRRVV